MRVIVPDTSVLVAAFFPERLTVGARPFDISGRAKPLSQAIRLRQVLAHAPDVLLAEFLKKTYGLAHPRDRAAVLSADDARAQMLDFISLPIIGVPAAEIAAAAADLALSERISPPDAWFLAAAQYVDAELWYTHRQADGIVEQAERLHPGMVFALTERRFDR